jgi:predicted nucleic acid-binding protein
MIVYVDVSALVKRHVLESGSENANALLEQAETVGSAALTGVEMASALAKAARMAGNHRMPVTLATCGRELWLAGQKTGLSVWPENLASRINPTGIKNHAYPARALHSR